MTDWYVTVDKYCNYPNDPERHVWTLSRNPNDTGWETDSGCSGYGLLKRDAEELASAANRIKKLEVALRYIQEKAFADLNEPSEMFILHDNDYVALEDYIDEVLSVEHGND